MRSRLYFLLLPLYLSVPASGSETVDWVARSDTHARLVLDVMGRFQPESAASLGVDGLDEEIVDLGPGRFERAQTAQREVLAELESRRDAEAHPRVRQDLEIMVQATRDNLLSSELERENLLPYFNVAGTVFQGIRSLIDPQIPPERYAAAVIRLRKYAGLEPGTTPLAELAKARTSERFEVDGLIGPYREEVVQDLERAVQLVAGLEQLLEGAGVEGWQEPYDALAEQLEAYDGWLRAEILPRARDDYRLPRPLYENALRNWGVDRSPEELIDRATQGFIEIRNEMIALAPIVAAEKGWDITDYREVVRRLKQEQIPGPELLDFYQARLRDLEAIIREQDLVTLPERPAGIRIATQAETAVAPAPHLELPRLLGNTGEFPNFVLPSLQNEDGSWRQSDDTSQADAWTLTAHEARPGHELQFSSMIEGGVSLARALFAFNSANVEGWALYAESIVKPYLPLDAQLIALQHRLARAARMFLDPMLNLGQITPEAAKRVLTEDVVLGESWAQNEIERYTYRIPGQATAYFYGYTRLQALRARTELALGDRFDARTYHDFLLAQGLLPPDLLARAVKEQLVGKAPAPGEAVTGRDGTSEGGAAHR